MKLGLAEILENASKLKSRKEKIEYLQKNDSRSLQDLIQYALHPAIVWDLPEGAPPYKPTDFLDQENMLYTQMRKLSLFVNKNGSNLKPARLEQIFVQILESIAPKDAELLLLVKDRKLPKGITPALVQEVWPGLIPSEADEKVSEE
jgi:hypothetical protein